MSFHTTPICPHCGTKNTIKLPFSVITQREVLRCDTMLGGCDELFYVAVHVNVSVEAGTLNPPASKHHPVLEKNPDPGAGEYDVPF